MAPLKFCANLAFLFTENGKTLTERYVAAKNAGFHAVEGPCPALCDSQPLIATKNKLKVEQVLLNISIGDEPNGNFGCASFPGCQRHFQENLKTTVALAKDLNCPKIHIMAGKLEAGPTAEHHKTYVENLKFAAKELEANRILGVIEPINKYAVPGYYLNSYDRALDVLAEVNSPSLKIMVDLYHLQHIRGDCTAFIKENGDKIGHVQIAQVPMRHEPDTDGELNLRYVLKVLEESAYTDGWVGCEYRPTTTTEAGLGWIGAFGYKL